MNFHKRCVFKVPNDCSYKKKRRNSLVGSTNSNSSLGYQSSVSSSVDGETLMNVIMNVIMMNICVLGQLVAVCLTDL